MAALREESGLKRKTGISEIAFQICLLHPHDKHVSLQVITEFSSPSGAKP